MASMNRACEHKELLRCELTAVAVCCMCADARPLSQAYPTYVDGSGMRNQGTRWQKYCWRCRDHWRAQDQLDRARRVSENEETWSFSSQLSTNTPLSPFSGTRRRSGRSQRSVQQRPLYSIESFEANSHGPLILNPLNVSQSSTRRDDNHADHISPPETRRRPAQNPFGTREEWEAPDYQSPLAGMFTRAWNRYRDAETDRRRAEAEIQDQMQHLLLNPQNTQQPPDITQERTHFPRTDTPAYLGASTSTLTEQLTRVENVAQHLQHSAYPRSEPPHDLHGHPNFPDSTTRPFYPSARLTSDRGFVDVSNHSRSPSPTRRENPIDTQPTRPAPLATEGMNVSIACKICCEQKMDTLLLPCYHVAMCRWCAGIMRAKAQEDRERRRRGHGDGYGGMIPRVRGKAGRVRFVGGLWRGPSGFIWADSAREGAWEAED